MERGTATTVVPGLALLFPILYVPLLASPYWSGRYVLVLLIAAVAVPITAFIAARCRDAASVASAAFVAMSTVSTLRSDAVALSFWGSYSAGSGLVMSVALVGCWQVGRLAASESAKKNVRRVLLSTAAANALLAVLQTSFDLEGLGLGASEGRGHGLMGNPVFLGAFLAAALWLGTSTRVMPTVFVVAFAMTMGAGVEASGSRVAFGLAVAIIIIRVVRQRWRGLAVAAAFVVGTAVVSLVGGEGSGTTDRLAAASAGSGLEGRLYGWRDAGPAIRTAPLLGAGPGRFLAATVSDRSLGFVREWGAGRYYADAHNVIVEHAVTVGLMGLVALLAWLALAFREVRDAGLAGFALTILATQIVEPQNISATPLAFIALGAARKELLTFSSTKLSTVALTGAAIVGCGSAATIAYGLWNLNIARLDFERSAALAATAALPPWYQASEQLARVYVLESDAGLKQALVEEARAARRAARRDDPRHPEPLRVLATYEYQLGNVQTAREHFASLLRLDPWNVGALNALARIDMDTGDLGSARRHLTRSLLAEPNQRETRELLESLG